MKPFIPDYIPTIGEVDAFLKPERPDGSAEVLGLSVLDEPCLNQSKKSYLDLMIKQFYKGKRKLHEKTVHSISNAHKKPKEVASWIQDVEQLQKQKQAPNVFYSNKMPEIDNLMQNYDDITLNNLEQTKSNSDDLLQFQESDIPLDTLAKSLCSVIGIPVYQNKNNESILYNFFRCFANKYKFREQFSD